MSDAKRPIKTLERVISKAGLGSRTAARSWIGAGRVKVNGKSVQTPDHWVDPSRDVVTLDGKPVAAGRPIYLALYKPKGYITSNGDPQGRPTVYDLLSDLNQFVIPVGRLDQDTSGLLLMTNDTEFAEWIMNPEHEVAKTYLVKAATLLTADQIDHLRRGVELDDGPTKPAEVRRVRDSEKHSFIQITIREGRNREIRRMLDAVGSRVLKLVRTSVGSLKLGTMAIGGYRQLTPEEVRSLFPRRSRKLRWKPSRAEGPRPEQ